MLSVPPTKVPHVCDDPHTCLRAGRRTSHTLLHSPLFPLQIGEAARQIPNPILFQYRPPLLQVALSISNCQQRYIKVGLRPVSSDLVSFLINLGNPLVLVCHKC